MENNLRQAGFRPGLGDENLDENQIRTGMIQFCVLSSPKSGTNWMEISIRIQFGTRVSNACPFDSTAAALSVSVVRSIYFTVSMIVLCT